ncbi:MAG: tyrosine-protein phosphatase [Dehalococcoidia bacterium]|nr:tyrosine-protein phosphatase [Dehalococcoidia bacterium]
MITATDPPTRHIPLTGARNVRDVGGYPTVDGRRTRWRVLLRGDSVHRLSDDDQAQLIALGLRTVIDLRRADEIADEPSVFERHATVAYHHVPLIGSRASARADPPRTLDRIYTHILDTCHEPIGQIAALLSAGSSATPTLVHCTAGKDRTGVVVAILLALAGAPDTVIADDYALTERYQTDGYYREARARADKAGIPWEQYRQLLICPPDFMLGALRHLRDAHGGAEAYLRASGLTNGQIASLRTLLVEDDPRAPAPPAERSETA